MKLTFSVILGDGYNTGNKTEFVIVVPDDVLAKGIYVALCKDFINYNNKIQAKVNEQDAATIELVSKLFNI